MGRLRTFDEPAVLTAAMLAFREHGYAAVSVKDLEQVTGISSGSLYNAYGDKKGLYRAVLAHYIATIITPRVSAAVSLDDLERLFLSLFELPFADGHGCLVTNSAIEFGPDHLIAGDLIASGLDAFGAAAGAILRRDLGPEAGELAAHRLLLLYQGILVLSRAGRSLAPFMSVIHAEFSQLRGSCPPRRPPC